MEPAEKCDCGNCDELPPLWVEVAKPIVLALAVSLLLIVFVKFGLFMLYPEPW